MFTETLTLAIDVSPCGDWKPYKDDHCYRLFSELQSYSDAEKTCQTNNSSMVSIHYAEEQNFLTNYIFTRKKTVENVWIGARYIGNRLYQWEDHKMVAGSYSNWAQRYPRNLTDHCVKMLSIEGSEGRWADERCAMRNMVVCQQMSSMSKELLGEMVVELRR